MDIDSIEGKKMSWKTTKYSEDYIKTHALFQTTTKSPVKFQKNRYKILGGVAHTRYPLSINFDRNLTPEK